MKKLFFAIIIFISTNAFSQSTYYSLTLNTGTVFPGTGLSGSHNVGFNLGLDLQNYDKDVSFFAELNGNIFKVDNEYAKNNSEFLKIIELTAGPRFFIKMKSMHPFVDIGTGVYFTGYSYLTARFGFSLGIGTVVKLNEKYDMMFKVKYHPYYETGQKGYGDYFGIYAGIKYNL
jgi:hypothetical protein